MLHVFCGIKPIVCNYITRFLANMKSSYVPFTCTLSPLITSPVINYVPFICALRLLVTSPAIPGDSLTVHKGQQFSTWDQDHDASDILNCADNFHGGWWYNDCLDSNLNGQYLNVGSHMDYEGIPWKTFKGYNYSMKKVEMKIRPKK